VILPTYERPYDLPSVSDGGRAGRTTTRPCSWWCPGTGTRTPGRGRLWLLPSGP